MNVLAALTNLFLARRQLLLASLTRDQCAHWAPIKEKRGNFMA